LWLPAQMACLRALAQSDPRKALEEVKRIDPAARKLFPQIFPIYELDLLVFSLRDASAEDLARRIAFESHDAEVATLAKIRIGDLYRLTGRIKPAIEQYQSVQKQISDETGGRKVPAQDRAYSIAVEDLLENGLRIEAAEKLRKWELGHPMAKFDSDFLLLRGRMLNAFGRWSEALVELDSFKNVQPDSPYEIDADFQRAEALNSLGKTDEAQNIWKDISTKYPRHELAGPSKARLAKP
ncbi:MAG: tetratricopeptide repeat protein, partial [Verrucomicrobiota bacterium]